MLIRMVVSSPRYTMALACLCTIALLAAVQPAAAPTGPGSSDGHLVLVVEGDVTALRITHVVAKPDEWGGPQKGLQSPFSLRALDEAGKELVRVPIDLSRFETDPGRVGKPDVVNGCEVRSSRIGVLLNVPVVKGVARYQFVSGDAAIGDATAADVARMLQETR